MKKILGIDTGTNSLGWAIVGREGDDRWLLDKGVNIFQEGVKSPTCFRLTSRNSS